MKENATKVSLPYYVRYQLVLLKDLFSQATRLKGSIHAVKPFVHPFARAREK